MTREPEDSASAHDELADLRADVARLGAANARNERLVAELGTALDTLLQILRAKDALAPGHLEMIDRVRRHAKLAREPQIALSTVDDKYAVENSEIDCPALMHLCHGRCCSFNIPLSQQDLDEGKLAWRIREPYLLAQSEAGYCVYQDATTGFCGTYDARPATCRTYDCRHDTRVWLDFEARLPAPMPSGLVTLRRRPPPA
jgi:Fe-S-cluster containining protein